MNLKSVLRVQYTQAQVFPFKVLYPLVQLKKNRFFLLIKQNKLRVFEVNQRKIVSEI